MNAGHSHSWSSGRSSSTTGLHAGDHLDRYELLCPLAQGGMAAVWLARLHGKHGFQKLFAVKTILPQYAEDIRFQQMFLDEARIAAGIAHPFVAQILDLGEERGILYIVMEWVDGDSLAKLLRTVLRARQRFPLNIAMRIAADVAGALHAAHELKDGAGRPLGVVHRDVSPSNILLSTKGAPKVIDFGIAKAVGRLTEETSAGLLKGKVMYMAPEQATGRPVDRRADVWAVAAVLHTLLAGEPPFTGDNELATLNRLAQGTPPNPLPANIPGDVVTILRRAMAHHADDRTPTAAQLQQELEECLVRNGMATTSADVAQFAAVFLADADVARHETVQQALDMASARARQLESPSGVGLSARHSSSVPAGPTHNSERLSYSSPPQPTHAVPLATTSQPLAAPAFILQGSQSNMMVPPSVSNAAPPLLASFPAEPRRGAPPWMLAAAGVGTIVLLTILAVVGWRLTLPSSTESNEPATSGEGASTGERPGPTSAPSLPSLPASPTSVPPMPPPTSAPFSATSTQANSPAPPATQGQTPVHPPSHTAAGGEPSAQASAQTQTQTQAATQQQPRGTTRVRPPHPTTKGSTPDFGF